MGGGQIFGRGTAKLKYFGFAEQTISRRKGGTKWGRNGKASKPAPHQRHTNSTNKRRRPPNCERKFQDRVRFLACEDPPPLPMRPSGPPAGLLRVLLSLMAMQSLQYTSLSAISFFSSGKWRQGAGAGANVRGPKISDGTRQNSSSHGCNTCCWFVSIKGANVGEKETNGKPNSKTVGSKRNSPILIPRHKNINPEISIETSRSEDVGL